MRIELGDRVQIRPMASGNGPMIPRDCLVGEVVYLTTAEVGRVYDMAALGGREHWLSRLDIQEFSMAPLGRHQPPTLDGRTKRPLPRYYGPVIVRVDRPHKTTGKLRKPVFVHVFHSEIHVTERPVRPEVPAEEVAKALIECFEVGELVFDGLREDLHSHLLSDQWDTHVHELKLDADEQAAEQDGGPSARELLRVLREFPRFARNVFWLMEHTNLWMPDPPVPSTSSLQA